MKYTIINSDTGAPFIQQSYDTPEQAQEHLDQMTAKFGDRYPLEIRLTEENEEIEETKAPADVDDEETEETTAPLIASTPKARKKRNGTHKRNR